MQEPIKNTENRSPSESALSDYQPDDETLHFFRKIGRVGNAISLLNGIYIAYQAYITYTFYRLITRKTAFVPSANIRAEYMVRFGFLSLLCLLSLISTLLLLRSSRNMLQYGGNPDNGSMKGTAKHLYGWIISLLAVTIVNAVYFVYVFLKTGNLTGN